MIKKLNNVSEGFFALLTQNNIRGYATEIEFSNLGQPTSSKAKFSQMDCKTGTIAIELKNESDKITLPEDAFVYANIKKPNGEIVTNPVEIISHEDGAILLQLKSQSIDVVGISTFEIVIKFGEDAKLISPKLTFEVFESYDVANNIFSEDQQTVLDKLVSDTEAKLNETEQKLTEVQEALNGVDDLAQEMRESTQENTQKIDQSIIKNTENINTAIDENTRRIDSAIEEGNERVSESISENTQKIESAILQNVEKINSAISENVDRVNSTIDENVTKINLAISNNTKVMEDAIADGSSRIDTAISENTGRVDAALSDLEAQVEEGRAVDTKLESTINAAKDFIGSLEENQDFIEMKNDISDVKNGLKSNQLLAYEGTNITCENTFDGRTEDLTIKGRTFQNIIDKFGTLNITPTGGSASSTSWCKLLKPNTQYTAIVLNKGSIDRWYLSDHDVNKYFQNVTTDIVTFTTPEIITDRIKFGCFPANGSTFLDVDLSKVRVLLLEGAHTKESAPNFYFEGIQSVGEEEINILDESHIIQGYIGGDDGSTFTDRDPITRTAIIPCEPNTTYTIVKEKITDRFKVGVRDLSINNGDNVVIVGDNASKESLTITTTSYARNMAIYLTRDINTQPFGKVAIYKSNKNFGLRPYNQSGVSILSSTSNFLESFNETVHLTRNTPTEYKKINTVLRGVYYQGLAKDGEFIVPSGSTTINFYDENKTKVEWLTLNGKPRKFDWGDILVNAKYYTIFNSVDDLVFDDVFMGKEPNYSMSETNKKEISLLTSVFKNNHNSFVLGTLANIGGAEAPSNTRVRTDFVEVDSKFTVSIHGLTTNQRVQMYYYRKDKSYISCGEWKSSILDLELPAATGYVRYICANSDGVEVQPEDFDNVSMSNSPTRAPLCGLKGLPSGICDTIEQREDGVYLVQRIEKLILTGDEEWKKVASSDAPVEHNRFYIPINAKKSSKAICNKYPYMTGSSVEVVKFYITSTPSLTFTESSDIDTVEKFKEKLKNNQTIVYYELEEPIVTKLEVNDLQLEIFREVTHVMSLNQIPAILDFKIPSNIGSILQQNSKSINELYKLIDELVLPQLVENSSRIAEMKYRAQEINANDI